MVLMVSRLRWVWSTRGFLYNAKAVKLLAMRFTPVRKLKIKEGTVPKGGRQPVQLPIHMAPIQKYTNGKKNEVKAVQQSAKPA